MSPGDGRCSSGHADVLSLTTTPSRICDDAVGVGGDIRRVRHHDNGHSSTLEPLEQIQKASRRRRVEAAGGLVGQEDLGFVGQGACDRHSLSLATGELGWKALFTTTQIDLGKELEGPGRRWWADHLLPNIGSSTLDRTESWGRRLWS